MEAVQNDVCGHAAAISQFHIQLNGFGLEGKVQVDFSPGPFPVVLCSFAPAVN